MEERLKERRKRIILTKGERGDSKGLERELVSRSRFRREREIDRERETGRETERRGKNERNEYKIKRIVTT